MAMSTDSSDRESCAPTHHRFAGLVEERSNREGGSPASDHQPLPSTARTERVFLIAIGVAFAAFAWPVIKLIVQVYESNPDYAHGYLIPIVAAITATIVWKEKPGISLHSSWKGLPLILAGAFVVVIALWHKIALVQYQGSLGSQFLAGCGLWLCLAGLVMSLVDTTTLRRYRFPLLYLLLAIPLPANLTQDVMLTLRAIVSHWSEQILGAAGMLAHREGNLIHLTNVSLGIEDACSGIRSLYVMVAWAVAAAWITGCRKGRFALIILLAIPIALLQNLARVLASAVLANFIDPLWAEGWRHESVGWFTFVLAAIAFVAIANLVAGNDPTPETPAAEPAAPAPAKPAGNGLTRFQSHGVPLYSTVIAALFASVVANATIEAHYVIAFQQPDPPRRSFSEFPEQIADFRLTQRMAIPQRQLDMINPSEHFSALYEGAGGRRVGVMLLLWSPNQQTTADAVGSPHDPDICLPGSGWVRLPEKDFEPPFPPIGTEQTRGRIYQNLDQYRVLVFWWQKRYSPHDGSRSGKIAYRLHSLVDSWSNLQEYTGSRYSVYAFTDAEDNLDDARTVIDNFALLLRNELPEFGISQLGEN